MIKIISVVLMVLIPLAFGILMIPVLSILNKLKNRGKNVK